MSKEKYGITDAHYICDSAIFNTETNEILRLYQICDLLNEQNQKIAELKKALELVCSDAHGIAIECEGYYFGACSEKTFNWFEALSTEEKIKAHCNYFLNKAKEMLKSD